MQDQRHGIVVASALYILPRDQMDGRLLHHQLRPPLAQLLQARGQVGLENQRQGKPVVVSWMGESG